MRHHLWLSAGAITAGFMLADAIPGPLSSIYTDSLGPLLASSWLAFVARSWWQRNEARILALPDFALWAIVIFSAFLLLTGGIRLLWVDPWFFGPLLWPLVEIALTLYRKSKGVAPGSRRDRGHRPPFPAIEKDG